MANKIQIRRGDRSALPTLSNGEPGLCQDTKEVFIGNNSSNIQLQTLAGATDYEIYVATTALGGLNKATQGATGLLLASGTTTSTLANKLVDSGAAFTSALTNKTVYNATTDTWAKVTAVDSATQLSLSADIFTSGQSYKISSALDNIPEAFSAADSGYLANITIRVSPGTFSNDLNLLGKTAGDNKTLTLQGSTTGTTTISGNTTARQKITLNNLTFTGWIKAYFGADITWNTCTTSGSSRLYHYEGNSNSFTSCTIIFGNDPGVYTEASSTITKGYTTYVASSTLGGSDATGDGLSMYTGTATSTTANKLVDSAANFGTDVVGKTLYNSTNDTWAKVTARDSATQLSISVDIMTSGDAYVIANAFSTITGATAAIPGTVNCNTTVKLSNEIYREATIVQGKGFSGPFSITYAGSRGTTSTSGTATAGANPAGNGSAGFGTLTDTGKAWTTNAYQNYFVEITGGTGAGQIMPIHANTGTVITIAGRWNTVPDATSVYRVYPTATRVTGADAGAETTPVRDYCFKLLAGQKSIVIRMMKIDYAGNDNYKGGVMCFSGSDVALINCWIEGCNYWGLQCASGATGSLTGCVGRLQVIGDVYVETGASITAIKQCRFTGWKLYSILANGASITNFYQTYIGAPTAGTTYALAVQLGSMVYTDAYLELDGSGSHNVVIKDNGTLFANGLYGARTTQVIKNAGGWGVYAEKGGMGDLVSGLTYSGNASGTYTPTSALVGGNA